MRKRSRKQTNQKAMEFIERNYPILVARCAGMRISAASMDIEDVLHETILFVLADDRFEQVHSDEEFIRYFMWRLRMIVFQTVQDHKQAKNSIKKLIDSKTRAYFDEMHGLGQSDEEIKKTVEEWNT